MFQFEDDLNKPSGSRKDCSRCDIRDFAKSGNIRDLNSIIRCSCSACTQVPLRYSVESEHVNSRSVKHGYLLLTTSLSLHRTSQCIELLIPSQAIVVNGIARYIIWGHDSMKQFHLEPINRSRIEDTRTIPSILSDLLAHQIAGPSSSRSRATCVALRCIEEQPGLRFLTLSQFKSVLSDNRKHAKSVWNEMRIVSLCPWVSKDDKWDTVLIDFDPRQIPKQESVETWECHKLCQHITQHLLDNECLQLISARFTFYRQPDGQNEKANWWLGDLTNLKVVPHNVNKTKQSL